MSNMNDCSDNKNDFLYKQICDLNNILTPLSSSYRLLAGAAEEFNRIALAHRKDVEEAIDRADEMGHIVDDMQDQLKRILRRYYKELDDKLDYWDKMQENKSMYDSLAHRLKNMVDEKKEDV
ncbi:MAG: hypothetical protein ACM3TR_03135 [Caulobacteraceae bacterium]